VDYWNELGWVDPFSSLEVDGTQQAYAGVLGNGNAYTPQMVVDGKTGLWAANRGEPGRPCSRPRGAESPGEAAGGKFAGFRYSKIVSEHRQVAGNALAVIRRKVWLAITETGLHSAVKRGENAGEDLHHAAVVRSIRKIGEAKAGDETSFSGDATVPLRAEWKRENLHSVVFVAGEKGPAHPWRSHNFRNAIDADKPKTPRKQFAQRVLACKRDFEFIWTARSRGILPRV